MNGSKTRQSATAQSFTEYLQDHGLRRTPERFMVLEAAESIPGGFFTTVQLEEALAGSATKISRATIFNTVDLLSRSGIIRGKRLGKGATRYEFANAGCEILLFCTRCGKVKKKKDDSIETIMRGRRYYAFRPEHVSVTIEGICLACTRKAKAAANTNDKTSQNKKT